MKTQKPILNPIDALLRNAFGVAMALQTSTGKSPRKRALAVVQEIETYLKKFPPEVSRAVEVRLDEGRCKPERTGGQLCEMMIPPRGRLYGGGYIAAVLLKVLVVAYLETNGTHLPINLKAWQNAADQDPSTPELRAAISGHERQFADALTSLFRVTHKGLRPFTALCRPCVEAMTRPNAIAIPGDTCGSRSPQEIAGRLFGKSLVLDLTRKTGDEELKNKRANALSKLGNALQRKVDFLKKGGRKND